MNPWDQKKWRGGVARPGHGGLVAFWLVALIFCGVGALIYFKAPAAFRLPWKGENFLALFPAVGALFGLGAVVKSLRAWRFRGTRFELDPLPGVIGGMLRGRLVLAHHFPRDAVLKVRLINEEKMTTRRRSGGETSTSTNVRRLYEHLLTIRPRQFEGGRFSVPVAFTVPYDTKDETDNAPWSETTGRSVSYRWVLKATADIPGANLALEFEVPVFRTADSDPSVVAEEPQSKAELERFMEEQEQPRAIATYTESGHKVYASGVLARLKLVFVMGLFGAIFGGAGVALLVVGINGIRRFQVDGLFEFVFSVMFTVIPLFMCVIFLGFGLLLFAMCVSMLSRKRTWAVGGFLVHRCNLLGISWGRKIPCAELVRFEANENGSVNGKPLYEVLAFHRAGKSRLGRDEDGCWKFSIVGEIPSKAEAQWLVEELRQQTGVGAVEGA